MSGSVGLVQRLTISLVSRPPQPLIPPPFPVDFGLKAKKSVIHPRSSLSNRSARLSLSSEKSYPNGLTSSENGAPSVHSYVRSKGGDLAHDDIEKSVHVNKDGSLSVEMKVRFRLINDETLQWSTHIKKSSLMNKALCEEPAVSEDNGEEPTENPEASSEMDDSSYPCDADSYVSNLDESEIEESRCRNCGKLCKAYDIWKNPLHAGPKEEPGAKNTWHTHSSCSSTSSHRRIIREKVASVDSVHTSSSGEEYTKHVVRESSHYTETVRNTVEYHSVKKCSCPCDCLQASLRQNGTLGERDAIGSSANSEKEEDGIVVGGEAPERKGSRPGSTKSGASRCSAESQIEICEEACSVERTISSSSIKARKEMLDSSSCPHSFCSRSSKCSTPDRLKAQREEVSESDQAVSSFSADSCPKNNAAARDLEEDDEEIHETYSASEKAASDPPARDDASESERCSSGRSFYSRSCDGNSRRSDSNEAPACSAASSFSRTSQRSKRSRNRLDTGSQVSSGSRRRSATKKKQAKSSLHADDARSNSRTSCYSRSSREVEKRDTGCHASRDSSPPRSNVSSLSETAAPPAASEESAGSTSKCYSRSTRSGRKGSQPEGSLHTVSPCSSFSNSGGENGRAAAKISSEADSSQRGNWSESTCSKCAQAAETWHEDLRSVSSRVSSRSEAKSQRAATESSRRSEGAFSLSSAAQSSKRSRRKTRNLGPEAECSSQASASASASVYSLRCPAPPKGRPGSRQSRPTPLKKRNHSASTCPESQPAADGEQKGATGSQPPETDATNEMGDPSGRSNKEGKACHGEAGTDAIAADDKGIVPSSLPNASPEDVVQEWLRKIPSDTLLMKCEMQDDGEGAELGAELPSCSHNRESLPGGSEERRGGGGEEVGEGDEAAAAEGATGGEADAEAGAAEVVGEEAEEEEAKEERSSEGVAEEEAESSQAQCELAALSGQNNHKKDLPDTVQTSVQIMKALLASNQEAKLDRAHSLPEVSPTMGRKLSHSANILITCLASLQLLDEELDASSKSAKGPRRPLYTELLNIFQALWLGGASEKGAACSGLQEEDQAKVPSSYKGHHAKEGDFTPMSSSGVDVSSGDGGSGEGSMAGAQDRALTPEKTDDAAPTEGGEGEGGEGEGGEEAANTGEELEHNEADERCSPSLTAFPTSEAGRKAESGGGEEGAGAEACQGSQCETEQEEEKEAAEEEEEEEGSQQEENAEGEETAADAETVQEETEDGVVVEGGEEEPAPGNGEEAPEESSNHEAEPEAAAREGRGEEEPPESGAAALADESLTGAQPGGSVAPQPSEKAAPLVQQRSLDPDPTWVLRLLKKIEKEFLAHYVTAMNELKLKWNLPDSEEVNTMISEVKEEVSRRIQRSIEKELMKIRSRAGQRVPRPPDQMQRESTLQVENRRRRLQSIHRMSLYNDRNANQSKQLEVRDASAEADEVSLFSTIRDDGSDQPSEDEYCPCDACIRKKLVARATRPPPVAAPNAPVVKAFDLQQILRMNKTGPPKKSLEDEIAEEGQEDDSRPAEGEVDELEANQEAEEGDEAGEAGEQEGQEAAEEQEATEEAAGILKEDVAEKENSEEAERESAANEDVREEAKVEEEETQEGKEEEEGGVEEEKEEEEAAMEEGEEEEVIQGEEKEEGGVGEEKEEEEEAMEEGEEEEVVQGEEKEEKEEGDIEEEKEEKAAMKEGEEEEVIQEEEKEEEEDGGIEEEKEEAAMDEGEEEVIQEEEKEEGGVGEEKEEEEAMEDGEKEEVIQEEEEEEEEEGGIEEEKEETAMGEGEEEEVLQEVEKVEEGEGGVEEEKEEEEVEQGKEEDVDVEEEEKEEEEVGKLEEMEQENEQESAAQEAVEDKEIEEEEENAEGEKEEDKTEEEEEGKEGQPVEEEEEKEEVEDEMEEGKGADEEQGGGEGDHDESNEKEEAKEEEEEEKNEDDEEDKGMDEGQEERQKEEDNEEAAKGEDETDNTGVGADAERAGAEGESQRDASECAENADGVEGSETEAAGEEGDGEGEAQASDGKNVSENEAGPGAGSQPGSETAGGEGEGQNGAVDEADAGAEEGGREDESGEPEQVCPGEEDPAAAAEGEEEEEEEDDGEADGLAQSLRKRSAVSSMGNFSQQSQKGSEDANEGQEGQEESENASRGQNGEARNNADGQPGKMYPDSEEEEEQEEEDDDDEGKASRPASAGKGAEAKTSATGDGSSQASKNKDAAIDQDDLDF